LRLGQRKRAFQFDRVLRRHDMERTRQRVRGAGDRDRVFLHRLQQRRLRLWCRAVDLVGEHEASEHRPALEAELALAAVVIDDLGARHVARHQVRRELDARELEAEAPRQGAD